jgi:hypothetical protein
MTKNVTNVIRSKMSKRPKGQKCQKGQKYQQGQKIQISDLHLLERVTGCRWCPSILEHGGPEEHSGVNVIKLFSSSSLTVAPK